jgi:hypothetical protein
MPDCTPVSVSHHRIVASKRLLTKPLKLYAAESGLATDSPEASRSVTGTKRLLKTKTRCQQKPTAKQGGGLVKR